MRRFKLNLLLIILPFIAAAQDKNQGDSLAAAGFSRMEINEIDSAKALLSKAKSIYRQLNIDEKEADMNLKLGEICIREKEYLTALDYLKLAYDYYSSMSMRKSETMCGITIGRVYIEMENYVTAREYLNKSLNLAKANGFDPMEAEALLNIGLSYNKSGDLRNAEEFYLHCVSAADDSESVGINIQACRLLTDLYIKKEDYELAYSFLHKSVALNDSILKNYALKEVEGMKNLFNSTISIQETELLLNKVTIDQLQTDLRRAKLHFRLLFLFSMILMLSLLVIGYYLYHKATPKTNKALD